MTTAPALKIDGLHVDLPTAKSGQPKHVVNGISITVTTGEILGLVGGSGCGKTTLARAALGLVPITRGRVRIMGTDLTTLKGRARRAFRRHMQLVFQDPAGSLNGRMRVGALIAEPMLAHGTCPPGEAASRVESLLAEVGLPTDAAQRWPHQFSGGQKQRIAIARALACDPSLLFCDEPTSALDVSVQARILNLLRRLQRERGLAMIFITHDLPVARWLCDRIAVMDAGRVVECGPTDEVLHAPRHAVTQSLVAAAEPASTADTMRA